MSSNEKKINESDLKDVSGGSGIVTTIDCPSCNQHTFKIVKGNTIGHCTNCNHSEPIRLW